MGDGWMMIAAYLAASGCPGLLRNASMHSAARFRSIESSAAAEVLVAPPAGWGILNG